MKPSCLAQYPLWHHHNRVSWQSSLTLPLIHARCQDWNMFIHLGILNSQNRSKLHTECECDDTMDTMLSHNATLGYSHVYSVHPWSALSESSSSPSWQTSEGFLLNVFRFPLVFFTQPSGPCKLCLLLSAAKHKRETNHEAFSAITGRRLAQGQTAEKETNWFVLVWLCLRRRIPERGNKCNRYSYGLDWLTALCSPASCPPPLPSHPKWNVSGCRSIMQMRVVCRQAATGHCYCCFVATSN